MKRDYVSIKNYFLKISHKLNLFSCLFTLDLIHLSTTCKEGAQKDFEQFIETFFRENFDSLECEDDSKPTIIYSAFFEIPGSVRGHDYVTNQNGPIYSCCGPFMELDYDESIRQSRLLYSKMYPEDEFLPKAPEPEEIVIGDDDGSDGNVNLGVLADLIDEKKQETEIFNAEEVKNAEDALETLKIEDDKNNDQNN